MTMEDRGERDERGSRERMSEGIRSGIGILTAFKDAVEETIQEARTRGDLSADRAREIMQKALEGAHSVAEEAKDRLDLVHRRELEALRSEIERLEARIRALEEASAPPHS